MRGDLRGRVKPQNQRINILLRRNRRKDFCPLQSSKHLQSVFNNCHMLKHDLGISSFSSKANVMYY